MDAVLGVISIIAFILAAVCAVVCVVLFFKLQVRDAIRILQHRPMRVDGMSRANKVRRPKEAKRKKRLGDDSNTNPLPGSEAPTHRRDADSEAPTRKGGGVGGAVNTPVALNSEAATSVMGQNSEAPTAMFGTDSEAPTGMLGVERGEAARSSDFDDSETPTGIFDAGSEAPTDFIDESSETPTGVLGTERMASAETPLPEDSESPTRVFGTEALVQTPSPASTRVEETPAVISAEEWRRVADEQERSFTFKVKQHELLVNTEEVIE